MLRRGVDVSVEVVTPLPMSVPIIGESGCSIVEGRLMDHDIPFIGSHQATAIEPGEVLFENGTRRSFDLLLGIPPHTTPDVVRQSDLTDEIPWIKVDKRTLETAFPDVYAIGDNNIVKMANGKPLPMAGVFAQGEGEVVAERIAANLAGKSPTAAFNGEGGCFLETGNGEAVLVTGHFLAEPKPEVELTDSSEKYLAEKKEFEAERLEKWF